MQQARVFGNVTTGGLSESLGNAGGLQTSTIPADATLVWRLALAENIGGSAAAATRTVNSVSARIGWPSKSPEEGSIQLKFGDEAEDGTNRTVAIAHDATAAQWKAAIDALTDVTLASQLPVSVTLQESGEVTDRAKSYRIKAADGTQLAITAVDNELWPVSFVDVEEAEFDEGWVSIVTLRQTPVAEVDVLRTIAQNPPTISRAQDASDTEGVIIHEIQKLEVPPEFIGNSFTVGFGGKKTSPIGVPVSAEELIEKLNGLLDDSVDAEFVLATVSGSSIFIELTGSDFEGTNQDLLAIEVFSARENDIYIRLETDTNEMRALMRRADSSGEVTLPFTITLELEDEKLDTDENTVAFQTDLTFTQAVGNSSRNAAPSIVWNQPVSRTDFLKHSPNSVLVGHRGYEPTIGDGTATSFSIPHNLGSVPKTISVNAGTNVVTSVGDHHLHNGDPIQFTTSGTLPDPLAVSQTYWVLNRTATTFQVALKSNGEVIDLTDTGSGTHEAFLTDGAGTIMDVVVWDTGTNQRVPDDDYTVEADSVGALTISGFGTTPTLNQYRVAVSTMGRPATYQAHTHEQDEVVDLVDDLNAIRSRLTDVEAAIPKGIVSRSATTDTGTLTIVPAFRPVWDIYPLRAENQIARPASGLLSDVLPEQIDPLNLGRITSRLLRAVHQSGTPGDLPVSSGRLNKAAMTVGTVYKAAADVKVSRGSRGQSITLRVGEFAVYNGTDVYQVSKYGAGTETTYYPTDFEREIFRFDVNEKQLRAKRILTALFDLELGMFLLGDSEDHATAQWSLIVETGTYTSTSSPATTGANLENVVWNETTPLLEHVLRFGQQIQRHSFGFSIERESDGTTFNLMELLYGEWDVAAGSLSSANVALRGRLARFDLADAQTDPVSKTTPKGLVGVSGLAFEGADPAVGTAVIS